MSTDKRIIEAIPPRRQWDPRIVSGVKRVNSGEDPGKVALDLAMVVPGFSRTQLGAYTAAYNKLRQKKVKEGLFGSEEPDVADRDNKEQAVQALLGSEDIDVKKVPDEKLSSLIQGLGSITTESIDSQVAQIISVMREQHASRNDVLEALQVHVGFNLREAKEVLQEALQEGAPEEGNARKVDYKDYTITVHKNRAGMYTAKNDSGEPYTNVPQFRSAEEAIAWDKKNVDQMTESSSPNKTGVRYGVFSRGGSVGSKHNGPIETFDNVEDAKQYAARLRKTLTPGERKYYRMGYVVRALKEAAKIKPEDFGIDKYDFDSNGFLNVHQSVNLASSKLTSLPFKFGKVGGDFNCSDNSLTSLAGAPQIVDGDFYCTDNNLHSLEGAPREVDGTFACYDNKLTSLKGAPQKVGNFYCSYNELLSLEGAPQKVRGTFDCYSNNLTSLKGAPREVGGDFSCSYNELASLEGAPLKVGGSFYCYDNNLHSLEGAPREVGGDFGCAFNLTRFTIEDVKKVSKVGGPIHESGLPKLRGKTMESLKEATKDKDYFIDFIKKQINIDLSSRIVDSKNRGLIDLDITNLDKSILIDIGRFSKKYEKYKVLDNGKNEISIVFPNSKFWKSSTFNWMPISNRYTEASNIRSDLDTIVSKIEWWGYKYTADESDKGVSFSFSTETEANNVYKDLKRSRLFKDHWRLDIQGNELFYSIY